MMKKLVAAIVFALGALGSCSGGGTTGTGGFDYTGKVLTSSGAPSAGVAVLLEGPGGEQLDRAITASDGTFSFDEIESSDAIVLIAAGTPQALEVPISIPDGRDTAHVTFQQQPDGKFEADVRFETHGEDANSENTGGTGATGNTGSGGNNNSGSNGNAKPTPAPTSSGGVNPSNPSLGENPGPGGVTGDGGSSAGGPEGTPQPTAQPTAEPTSTPDPGNGSGNGNAGGNGNGNAGGNGNGNAGGNGNGNAGGNGNSKKK